MQNHTDQIQLAKKPNHDFPEVDRNTIYSLH